MAQITPEQREYFRVLSENALKGETYLIKFKNEPIIYEGIPMLRSKLSTEDENVFTLKISKPTEKQGVKERSISEIEMLKKR